MFILLLFLYLRCVWDCGPVCDWVWHSCIDKGKHKNNNISVSALWAEPSERFSSLLPLAALWEDGEMLLLLRSGKVSMQKMGRRVIAATEQEQVPKHKIIHDVRIVFSPSADKTPRGLQSHSAWINRDAFMVPDLQTAFTAWNRSPPNTSPHGCFHKPTLERVQLKLMSSSCQAWMCWFHHKRALTSFIFAGGVFYLPHQMNYVCVYIAVNALAAPPAVGRFCWCNTPQGKFNQFSCLREQEAAFCSTNHIYSTLII